jgi:hypothetical protein
VENLLTAISSMPDISTSVLKQKKYKTDMCRHSHKNRLYRLVLRKGNHELHCTWHCFIRVWWRIYLIVPSLFVMNVRPQCALSSRAANLFLARYAGGLYEFLFEVVVHSWQTKMEQSGKFH